MENHPINMAIYTAHATTVFRGAPVGFYGYTSRRFLSHLERAMPVGYQPGQRVSIPKDKLRYIRQELRPGVEFSGTDLSDIAENTGSMIRFAQYRLRVEEVGEEECECTVIGSIDE